MKNKTFFVCGDCNSFNLCKYYHNRRESSYICKQFVRDDEKVIRDFFEWLKNENRKSIGSDNKLLVIRKINNEDYWQDAERVYCNEVINKKENS